jgi:NADH dehydrogenase
LEEVLPWQKWHFEFSGFFAWFMWSIVHLYQLIGFRNRIAVLINWAWDYFFFERVVRLIMPSKEKC